MHPLITRFHLALAAFLLAAPGAVHANAYLDELVAEARAQQLAEDPYWWRLLYYSKSPLGDQVRSETVDPGFFVSERGHSDPQAELEADLAAFFRIDNEPRTGQPYQCRYIARYSWLKQRLGFDSARLPEQICASFKDWQKGINPAQATLVFASDYIGSPSSMFGHTLLRLDPPGQDEDTRILSYAINYAATTDESNGLLFAVRGLTGGYPGNFSVMPYYEKVKEYNDWENRDLWEYQLTLAPAELQRMMLHAWELGPTSFPYYYLDENCSFRLLGLLEAARPSLKLMDRFHLWAIPTDTVRVVLEQEGLLKKVTYRPAASTTLAFQVDGAPAPARALAYDLALGTRGLDDPALQALSEHDRARALEVAYAYLYYLFLGGDVEPQPSTARMRQLLVARSRISLSGERPQPPEPSIRPDQGHDTARIALVGGRLEHQDFYELRLRPSYHDLLDPPSGYKPGAQINFLDLALRYWADSGTTRLESLTVVDILSLTPRDRFFDTPSWNTAVGLERQHVENGERPLVLSINGGGGYTLGLGARSLLYASLQTRLQGGDGLPDKARAGLGPQLKLLTGHGPLQMLLSAEAIRYTDDSDLHWTVQLESRLVLGKDWAVGAWAEQREDYGEHHEQFGISLRWYL